MTTREFSAGWLTVAAMAVLGLGAGIASQYWWNRVADDPGGERPLFTLKTADNGSHSVTEWDGNVLVLNFWATWCAPCRREIPLFIDLQMNYGARGLQFVGVAIDEAEKVREFGRHHGINYPSLVGDADATEISRRYGNEMGVLPFTVVIGRDGHIVYRHRGEVTREIAEKVILPML